MTDPMNANRWYLLSAAALLLALAALNRPTLTLVVAAAGGAVGLFLLARGQIKRSGLVGVVG
ncbi:MAG: hypothetical protein N2439_16185, partial [Anaerolineae bacterium]|nr:hypothetical protein [Anaerolineae bacterium]